MNLSELVRQKKLKPQLFQLAKMTETDPSCKCYQKKISLLKCCLGWVEFVSSI